MEQQFYSNGKLLLTAEYVVLDGAKALALPTKKGQSMRVVSNNSSIINWKSFDCNQNIWYQTSVTISAFKKEKPPKGNSKFDETLFKILWQAQQLNPKFLIENNGCIVETYLDFERLWGLGTSSTLINNIASWAQVNAFELLQLSFGGSGYDIAAGQSNTPVFYTRTKNDYQPIVTPINFKPTFVDRLFFVYLEEKKDSKEAISSYRKLSTKSIQENIPIINQLTDSIAICENFFEFEKLLLQHENVLSKLLQVPTIKSQRFMDFNGAVKSLGGWGGDFVLATGTKAAMSYFAKKGYSCIIPYSKMILS